MRLLGLARCAKSKVRAVVCSQSEQTAASDSHAANKLERFFKDKAERRREDVGERERVHVLTWRIWGGFVYTILSNKCTSINGYVVLLLPVFYPSTTV